jgi:hypothetical protein
MVIRASPAGRRIASARIRTGLTGPACRQCPPQRCDATGPTRPARPIPVPNLGQVCVGPDEDGRRVCPPANVVGLYGSDTDVT